MDWSPLDLKNLSAQFDDAGDAILAYRKSNGSTLSQTAKLQLTKEYGALISAADNLTHLAAQGALKNVDAAVTELQTATHDAIAALQTITDVQKVMSIAVAAVALAASIVVAPSPGTIGAALMLLVKQVKGATSPAAPAPASGAAPAGGS